MLALQAEMNYTECSGFAVFDADMNCREILGRIRHGHEHETRNAIP